MTNLPKMVTTPVPPVPDQDRYAVYNPTVATTDFSLGFPLFGDATDIAVFYNGARLTLTTDYTVRSVATGATLVPVPVSDAFVRLNASVSSGKIEIYGARRPRRTIQASSAYSTRDFNVVFSDVWATMREMWSQFTRAIQVPAGENSITLPSIASRAQKVLGFDASGNPTALDPASGGVVGSGSLIDGAVTTPKIADGAVTLAKLAAALYNGTAGSLIQWATGPKYPAGDGSNITSVTAASVANGGTGTAPAAGDRSSKVPTSAWVGTELDSDASVVLATYTSATSLSPLIPADDTIPQVGEGTQILSATITLASASDKVFILCVVNIGGGAAGTEFGAAIFRNGAANAIQSAFAAMGSGTTTAWPVVMAFVDAPGAAGTYTYTVRVGHNSTTLYVNSNAGTRRGGGTEYCSLLLKRAR